MIGTLRSMQVRIEQSCIAHGVSYPWWIPAYSSMACVAIDIVAFVQRGAFGAGPLVIVAAVIALLPLLTWIVSGRLLPPWLEAAMTATAVAMYLSHPLMPDFAPFLLLISAGEVAAIYRMTTALIVAAAECAVLIVASVTGHLDATALYVVGVILGADVGMGFRWQMRALAAERANTVVAGERAMLTERQRVAREVHDVVGHALSINLLHVTAARHALQQHADIDDAVESLTEAEQVGRTAMADLRRTVAVLGSGPSETQALPGIDDLSALIERARLAGLDVHVAGIGDPGPIGTAAELGIYRIVQESLANIAKHAPQAAARVQLDVTADLVRLAIRNTLPPRHTVSKGFGGKDSSGNGLPGMAARAEQMGAALHAGVDGEHWTVELVLPLDRPRIGEPGAVAHT